MEMNWKLKGGHKQETRSGKNKIPLSSAKTINGVNLSVDEKGIYTLSGTATGDCFFSIPLKSVLTADVSRTMSLQILNGTASTTGAFYLAFRIRNSNGVYGEAELKYKSGTSKYTTKTITTECATAEITVVSGTTLNNIKLAIQLEDGTKATSIEQYGMMPSTDYPSEIETVGSNVQLFDKDNVNKLNGVPDVSNITSNTVAKSFYVQAKPNTTYTVSRKIIGSRFVVGTTANLPAVGETIIDRKVNNEGSSITLTTSKNVNYLVVYYLYNSGENEEEILDNIKIEKGSTATPWSAYGTGCTEIKVQNRNFLYYTAQNQTINGVEFLINKDKSIKVKGTATATTDFYLIGNANTYEDIGVTGNFKISGCKSNSSSKYMLYIVQKDINNKLSYYQNVQESINITIKKGDTFRVFIRVLSQITVNDTIFPALQSSDDNNSIYVESKKQTIVMPVQQEMLQGDYIEDVEHHEWGKYIFTGKETIENIGKSGDITFFKTSLSNLSDFNYIDDNTVNYMCTHFKAIKVADRFQNNTFFINIEKKVSLCSQEITTIDALKAYLKARYDANDPVMIYYKLANAIDLELTEAQKAVREQKLHTYKNVTNINLSDELASIDVTYKKDLDTILNNLQAQIIANASEEVTE
jgi:hypothetical protein